MSAVAHILFDAAGTLIHKPGLWKAIASTLGRHGYRAPLHNLKLAHRIVSDTFPLPDRTGPVFYAEFNARLLAAIGCRPLPEIAHDIYVSCRSLPWKAFSDVSVLRKLETPFSILSNFNTGLNSAIERLVPGRFRHILTSEELKARKPDPEFFRQALDRLGVPPREVLMVGDSVTLDIEPALGVGMQVRLIDRDGLQCRSEISIDTLAKLRSMGNGK